MKSLLLILIFSISNSFAWDKSPTAPSEILEDIHIGKLKFMGRALFVEGNIYTSGPGIRTCVFKNEKVYVLYRGCMGNKKEQNALDLTVIKMNGEVTKYYIENSHKMPQPLTQVDPVDYDSSWKIGYYQAPAIKKALTMHTARDYYIALRSIPSCNASYSFFLSSDPSLFCLRGADSSVNPYADQWLEDAESFLTYTPKIWVDTLKLLRKEVLKAY